MPAPEDVIPEPLEQMPSGKLAGHLSHLKEDPLGLLMSAMERGQRLVRLRIGYVPVFVPFRPDDIRRVLVDDVDVFRKTSRGYKLWRLFLGNGLIP